MSLKYLLLLSAALLATRPSFADDPAKTDPAKPPTAEEIFTQGRDALFQGEYDKAVDLLTKAVEADSGKTSYRLNLARALRYAGKEDAAVKQLEDILKAAPDHVEAGQTLCEIYAARNQWKEIVAVLEPLLKYRHDYPNYHILADAYYNLGDMDKARKNFEEAVKLNPQSAVDHYQLGNIYLGINAFALASESYQTALRLGLDTPVLHYKLGSALFNLRNYFGAMSVQEVKSGKPGAIEQKWYLVEAAPGRKDLFRCAPEISAVYQVAKALADGIEDRPDIHVLMASIYLNAGRYAQAYEMFEKIGPSVKEEDKALFYYYQAQAAFGIGNYDRYLELLGAAIKLKPDAYKSTLVDAYVQVADQYNQAGQLDRYVEFLTKAVGENPQASSLHLKLGNAYEEAQKFGPAVAQWRMVLDLEPDHPQRMNLLNLIDKYRSETPIKVAPKAEPKKDKGAEAKKK
jgi:tetratricopeptide (TPR) repeat protein